MRGHPNETQKKTKQRNNQQLEPQKATYTHSHQGQKPKPRCTDKNQHHSPKRALKMTPRGKGRGKAKNSLGGQMIYRSLKNTLAHEQGKMVCEENVIYASKTLVQSHH